MDNQEVLDLLPPELQEQGQLVLASSRFVSRNLQRHPQWFGDWLQSDGLRNSYPSGRYLRSLQSWLSETTSEDEFALGIRRFRNREMSRIAWRDIVRSADLDETLAALSELADACITHSCEWVKRSLQAVWGKPFDADGVEQVLMVIGMGKLGGEELNFSSDIDLIYVYPNAGDTRGGRRACSNHEYFDRFGKALSKILSAQREEGFVFRVDTRLRPFGGSGPLAISVSMLENYLVGHARMWERYAWIKARAITGSEAGKAQLNAVVIPFVFRKYLDYTAIESIRSMKTAIEREHRDKRIDDNVKLGPGGIREVEFIGQVLQLLYAGRETRLQARPIQIVLRMLADSEHLDADNVTALIKAYRFLRVLENRLQEYDDQQTQLMPADEAARERIARSMWIDDPQALMAKIAYHRGVVSKQFARLFAAAKTSDDTAWQAADTQSASESLQSVGYSNIAQLAQWLLSFRDGRAVQALTERARSNLDRLMPALLELAASSETPELVLRQVMAVVQAVLRRSTYLALMVERPEALRVLVRIAQHSAWVMEQIVRQPLLLDDLLGAPPQFDEFQRGALLARWIAGQSGLALSDEESQLDRLREFRHTEVLRVALADLFGAMPLMQVSDALSAIAETVVRQALAMAWMSVSERHGVPSVDGHVAQFAIIAFGKLGGLELGYSSDLDLVFLHDDLPAGALTDGVNAVEVEVFFTRLARKFIHYLTAPTRAGVAYEIDLRLRPNGSSGLMVSSVKAFARYEQESAWAWEHQALIRARLIVGHGDIADRFTEIRQRVLCAKRDESRLRNDVLSMRAKMRLATVADDSGQANPKSAPGGVTDCEFMVQYLVLRDAFDAPELCEWTDNIRLLNALATAGSLTENQVRVLSDAYIALRKVIHEAALQNKTAAVSDDEWQSERNAISAQWRQLFDLNPGEERLIEAENP